MFASELVEFVFKRKKYWLLPILFTLLALAILIVSSQSVVLPFVYTMF